MRLKLRGKLWHFLLTEEGLDPGDYGSCDPPDRKGKAIRVRPGLSPADELDTIIHEMTHACSWDLSEEAVTELATDISRGLRKLGYRRVDLQ